MNCCNAYESNTMTEMMGETIRPGGFTLTEKGVNFCNFTCSDSILDLGCGLGATIGFLYEKYHIAASGIDPSDKLLSAAKEKHGYAEFTKGTGEQLPYMDKSFQGVFSECTLSLMKDLDSTLNEVFRVLNNDGWFIITDVYAKNPENIALLDKFSLNSCVRGLHDLNTLKEKLEKIGFKLMFIEDCSNLLKELMVKIVFSYGSMSLFWNRTTNSCIDGCEFENILRQCKPGYFMIIAKKGEANNG